MLLWYIGAMIRHNESVRLTMDPCTPRPSSGPYVTPQLKRAIAARWKVLVPWVRMQQLRARDYDPSIASAESDRLCQRHSEHVLAMIREGISMRTIRRRRLDDPRLTDEVCALLVAAARERQSKARFRRTEDQRARDKLATLIKLGPIVRNSAPKGANNECPERCARAEAVLDPPALKAAIQVIRCQVCDNFYLRELRDPELQVRTNRPHALSRDN
jgi:hypothetical protein